MERIIRINQKVFNKYQVNRFALQEVLQGPVVGREYKISGQWTSRKPDQRPEGTRVVFDSINLFRSRKDAYFAWQAIAGMQNPTQTPELPDEGLTRIINARETEEPLVLFVPWGVRVKGSFGESEAYALNRIKDLATRLRSLKMIPQVLIMPADLYATEVNRQVSVEEASRYFTDVAEQAKTRGFLVKPWSEIREANKETYQERSSELTEETIVALLTPQKLTEAEKAAKKRSGYTEKESVRLAALAYLRERICEAEIIERVYRPIKVSAVAKNKDNGVDRALPRIYILPDEYQFPWLK